MLSPCRSIDANPDVCYCLSAHGHCNCEMSANDPQCTIRLCQALLRADQTMHASCGLCPRVLYRDLKQTKLGANAVPKGVQTRRTNEQLAKRPLTKGRRNAK